MKTYNDLTPIQRDLAVDKALEVLVKILLKDEFDYKFKSLLAQEHFYNAFRWRQWADEFDTVMGSDEIAEELYPVAESMAEIAYYPTVDEYVFPGIVA